MQYLNCPQFNCNSLTLWNIGVQLSVFYVWTQSVSTWRKVDGWHIFCLNSSKSWLLQLSLWSNQVVFVRETRVLKFNDRSISVTITKSDSALSKLEPVPKGIVRIPQFQQTIAIAKHGETSAKGLFLKSNISKTVHFWDTFTKEHQ